MQNADNDFNKKKKKTITHKQIVCFMNRAVPKTTNCHCLMDAFKL